MEEEIYELLYKAPDQEEHYPLAQSIDRLFNMIIELQKEVKEVKELKETINSPKN